MPHAAIIRYIRNTKHFCSWNVYDNMCRMCRGSFWSWSEIDYSNFDKDMRYKDMKNDFYVFISSYLDLWPLNIKFAPLVTLVQSGVSIKLEVSMAFCFLSVCGTWIYCLLPALHAHLPCTTLLNSEECALSEKKMKKRQLQARDGWTDGQGATLNAHP